MKAKINLTIDEKLVPLCKEYARARGKSVSQLVEELLRKTMLGETVSFSIKWRGKFKAARKKDAKFEKLKDRYLM